MKHLYSGFSAMLLMQLVSFFFPGILAIDPDCNYNQVMQTGVSYYVYNREYPGYYPAMKTCRWVATSPVNTKISLSCNIEMPQSTGCSNDRLLVSTTGNINLENAHSYCGFGNTTLQSVYNNITIGLITGAKTNGGRFLCTMKVVEVSPPQCDCGWKNTRRIVGGVETKVNEYPMMAGLVDYYIREIYCGATIVATRYALTAAHCVQKKQLTAFGLLIGDHDISTGSETDASKLMAISKYLIHPMYDSSNPKYPNDIAIVTTAELIPFSMRVGPACLPFRNSANTFAGSSAELLGWGTTEFTGPKSDVLLKTDVNVISKAQCGTAVGGTVDQLCTFKQGHDACQADSGGPLLWTDPSNYRINLIGVISIGMGCASSKPAVNTRVTSYLTWITQNTPGAEYCIK